MTTNLFYPTIKTKTISSRSCNVAVCLELLLNSFALSIFFLAQKIIIAKTSSGAPGIFLLSKWDNVDETHEWTNEWLYSISSLQTFIPLKLVSSTFDAKLHNGLVFGNFSPNKI